MPFIVEDGTGIVGANSYASVADADAYFTLMNKPDWLSLTQVAKEASLMQASQYMDLAWGSVYPGTKWEDDQGLLMPRKLCCNDTDPWFPAAVLTACFEYGIRASVGSLAPDPEFDDSGRQATLHREKVGPLEEEYRWGSENGPLTYVTFRPMPIPDGIMRSFLGSGGYTGGRVIR